MAIGETSHKEALKDAWDAIFEGDLEVIDEIYAEDVVASDPTTIVEGIEAYKEYTQAFLDGFSDLEFEVLDMIEEDEVVVTHTTNRGIHDKEFDGIPPNGNSFETKAITIDRFENGKVVEETNLWDNLGFLEQLGIDPSDL